MFADSRRSPGCYDVDDALCADLERALFGAGTRSYATLDLPVLPNMTIDDFRRRASTVPGWDAIVALSPYGQSSALAQDGLLLAQGPTVCECMADVVGFPQEGCWDFTVVGDGRILGSFGAFVNDDWQVSRVIPRGE
jgi:hypothetical protein